MKGTPNRYAAKCCDCFRSVDPFDGVLLAKTSKKWLVRCLDCEDDEDNPDPVDVTDWTDVKHETEAAAMQAYNSGYFDSWSRANVNGRRCEIDSAYLNGVRAAVDDANSLQSIESV